MEQIELNDQIIPRFEVAKAFKDNTRHISSLDFDASGSMCVTGSSDDESIRVYDAQSGKLSNTIYSKKYGCSLVQFTHKNTNIIYASTKEDDGIRYMSLYDNKYIRYFKGHKKRVVALDMSPHDDTFLSGSEDGTVRFWDLRSPNCNGLMYAQGGDPYVTFDPSSDVYAIVAGTYIRLYDLRNFEKGCFAVFPITNEYNAPVTPDWTRLSFSNDGKHLLLSSRSDTLYVFNSFDGQIRHRLRGHLNQMSLPLEATFTPDNKYIMCGAQDGRIHWWNVESGQHVASNDWHREPCKVVSFNPRLMMYGSADSTLAFWLPKL